MGGKDIGREEATILVCAVDDVKIPSSQEPPEGKDDSTANQKTQVV
jgi:hypothetical protein